MDAFYDSLGKRTRDYGELAEEIFKYNVIKWMGNPVEAFRDHPDLDQVDMRIKLPSLMKDKLDLVPNDMVFDWQIKHTSRLPSRTKLYIQGEKGSVTAWNTKINKKAVANLRERVRQKERGTLFLAYGIAKQDHLKGTSLVDEDPYDVFDWYAIDLRQYFSQVSDECDTICIPIGNRLNLFSFTLLWASRWVKDFYDPLTSYKVAEHKHLTTFVKKVYRDRKEYSSLKEVAAVRNELEKKLPKFLQSLQVSTTEKRQISTVLGLGVSLEDICMNIRNTNSIEQIRTYCPESLYGTASLWLFSRSYWNFMSKSAIAVSPEDRDMNQRWLPVRSELKETPRLLWALLYGVVKLYKRLGVNIAVVRPFNDNELGADRSVYGGNIGHLPYISLASDGLHWTRETLAKGDLNSHKDFFAQSQHDVILGQNESLINVPALNCLPKGQLELSDNMPRLLFAEENIFIRHPIQLWNKILK